MHYLHTMVRIRSIDESLHFYCGLLGLEEQYRIENEKGRFTLIFLRAPGDKNSAEATKSPLLELTYNWPKENDKDEEYSVEGRGFGHLAYRVDNIYDLCQKLMDSGVTINRPPRDGHMAFIKSPDGISIELIQKDGSLPVQEPWASMKNSGSW